MEEMTNKNVQIWDLKEDYKRVKTENERLKLHKEMNNLHIKDGRYNLHGRFIFNTEKGELILTPEDALEIAYTLFDWASMGYDPIQEIEEKIEKGEL